MSDDPRDAVDIDEVVATTKAVVTEVFGPRALAIWSLARTGTCSQTDRDDRRRDLSQGMRSPSGGHR